MPDGGAAVTPRCVVKRIASVRKHWLHAVRLDEREELSVVFAALLERVVWYLLLLAIEPAGKDQGTKLPGLEDEIHGQPAGWK